MSTIWKLFMVQFRVRFGLSVLKYNLTHKKSEIFKVIFISIAIIVAFLNIFGMYTFLSYGLIMAAMKINHPEIVLTMVLLAAQVMSLIFGSFFIMGHLFLAKDNEFLASLPIPQWKVFASKFMHVYLSEMLISIALLLPPIIIYSVFAGAGFLFYLKSFIIMLFTPSIPLALAALLSLVLMRILGKAKHRDLFTVIFSFVFIVAFIVGQMIVSAKMPTEDFSKVMSAFLIKGNEMINTVGSYFPPSIWATMALYDTGLNGLFNFLGFILASAVSLLIVLFISNRIYFKGALAQLEASKSKKSGKKAKLSEKSSSPVFAIFKKEWRLLLRSPIYAMNSLIGIVLGPVMLIIPIFAGGTINDPDLNYLLDSLSNESQWVVIAGLAGFLSFLASMNPAASTVLSREGRAVWLCKTMPQSPKTQIQGKFLAAYSIPAITCVLSVIAGAISFKISPISAIAALVLSLIISLPITTVSVIFDLIRPKLTWNNEQEAIKQNLNVVIGMFAGILLAAIAAGAGALAGVITMSPEIGLITAGIVSAAMGAGSYVVMISIANWNYKKISE